MKKLIKKIPILRGVAQAVYFTFIGPLKKFPGSEDYWKKRYRLGGTSGDGSYRKLAEFKSQVLNEFVKNKNIENVIEFGCGDGNQLKLSEYPSYIGFDVSEEAIFLCRNIFSGDQNKSFKVMNDYNGDVADLALSLDVIYHLVEDDVFHHYMDRLFDSSKRYVVIFSSNTSRQSRFQAPHVKHRDFSKWIQKNRQDWNMVESIPNKYPYSGNDQTGSSADFYIYEKK